MKLPFFATLFTTLGILILCSLGTWQLERLEWKNDLISKLETAYSAENPSPIALDADHTPEFTYGQIEGTFMPDKAFLLGPPTMRDEVPGLNLIVPLKTEKYTLLVNMGWTSHSLEQQPIYHLQNKTVSFTGLLRYFSWNAFTPPNNPEEDIWYRLDVPLISASKKLENTYPAALIADSANYKFDGAFFSDAAQAKKMPNNNHLQYAFFWFAMAGALITVYVLRFIKNR